MPVRSLRVTPPACGYFIDLSPLVVGSCPLRHRDEPVRVTLDGVRAWGLVEVPVVVGPPVVLGPPCRLLLCNRWILLPLAGGGQGLLRRLFGVVRPNVQAFLAVSLAAHLAQPVFGVDLSFYNHQLV